MRSSFLRLAFVAAAILSGAAAADEKSISATLNTPFKVIADKNRSYRTVFDAVMQLKAPPVPLSLTFGPTSVWPGMAGWDKVSAWAKDNQAVGAALLKAQDCIALGMPYGSAIEPKYQEAGLWVRIGTEETIAEVQFPYLDKMRLMATWAVAEMYRLGGEGKFDDAFNLAVANLRVLRQGCDQRTLREKVTFMQLLAECASANRAFMWANLAKIPAESFQKASLKGYSFLRQTDNERLKRLELPEGDKEIQMAVLAETFGPDGQADPDKFAAVWGGLQAKQAPLTAFGAAKRWRLIATVHGSLDASQKRLGVIYDDWWRRWRMRPFDSMLELATELSRTNTTKYAAVVFSVTDLQAAFDLRMRLVAEVNGTAVSAALCGFYKAEKDTWPSLLSKVFPTYGIKRFNYDPFDKRQDLRGVPEPGPFEYRQLSSPAKVNTEWGQITISGCILYSKGADSRDDGATDHSSEAKADDFILFPPPRAVARQEGKLK